MIIIGIMKKRREKNVERLKGKKSSLKISFRIKKSGGGGQGGKGSITENYRKIILPISMRYLGNR